MSPRAAGMTAYVLGVSIRGRRAQPVIATALVIVASTVVRDGDRMPGVRLGIEERGAIALGLARQERFSDIARRMKRPTSTISLWEILSQ